jgi:tetratricopeptide (TPR) repeat protein
LNGPAATAFHRIPAEFGLVPGVQQASVKRRMPARQQSTFPSTYPSAAKPKASSNPLHSPAIGGCFAAQTGWAVASVLRPRPGLLDELRERVMKLTSLLALAAVTGVIAFPSAARAQYPVLTYGKGPALTCYELVKSKRLNNSTLEVCDSALKDDTLSPKNRAATYNNRGIVNMRNNNRAAAERDYHAALKISPNIAETQINLGAMFYANDMFTEAVSVLNQGVKAEELSSRAVAHYNRALALEKLGELDEAYADLQTAVRLNPGLAAASQQLARYRVERAS